MTNEQKRIKIAEICGWKLKPERFAISQLPVWHNPSGWPQELPDYLDDLDAMHDAELLLTAEQRGVYLRVLAGITLASDCLEQAVFATASQRAEAFLKVFGQG